MLTLYEEITLLSLHPRTNKFPTSVPAFFYNITAAMIVELSIRKRLHRTSDGVLTVIDRTPTGDPLLDTALVLMGAARHPSTTSHWIIDLTRISELHRKVIGQLTAKGIIAVRKKRILFIPFIRYHFVNPAVIESLKHKIMMTDNGFRNERISALITLVLSGTTAIGHLFTPVEWEELKDRFAVLSATLPLPAELREVLSFNGGDEVATILLLTAFFTLTPIV